MKKILFILMLMAFVANGATAQNKSTDQDQITSMKRLNREYGYRFEAIGKDRSLSGYEKGQRKRALAIQKRQDIDKILNGGSVSANSIGRISDSDSYDYKSNRKYYGRNEISDKYDDMIDDLEDKYDDMIDDIEDNDRLSKYEKKTRIKALKNEFKAKKELLKAEKEKAKREYDY